jgi:hypothetical protein
MSDALTTPFVLSLVTVGRNQGHATKKIIADAQGRPQKDPQRALWISGGTLEQVEVVGLQGLATLLPTVTKQQALVHGVPKDASHGPLWKLVTADHFTGAPGTITRTLDHLDWPTGPHLLLFDYDPDPKAQTPVTSADELLDRLAAVWPAFRDAAYLVTTSTSSGITHKTTGEWLVPPYGMHCYPLVVGDVARFREALKARLWLAGEGFVKLASPNSHTGVAARLERALIDLTVLSPERLDYVAGAEIAKSAPFIQIREAPVIRPGGMLDLDTFPPLTDDERARYGALVDAAKARLAPEQHATIRARIRQQQPTSNDAAVEEEVRARLERATRCELTADHPLYFARAQYTAGTVTRAQDGKRLRDPFEPDYGPSQAVFHWNGGDWCIVSWAHGVKKVYRLETPPRPAPHTTTPSPPPRVGNLPLQVSKDGTPLDTIGNLLKIFRHHPAWHDRLWLDSVRTRPMLDTQPLTDHDAIKVAEWLGDTYDMRCRHPRLLLACLEAVCTEHPRDRLRAWLEALPPWDGIARLHDWLQVVAGVQPGVYCTAVSRLFLLALVARALDPGAICRTVVILQGPEDTGKSSLLHDLVGEDWYIETSGALEGKEPHLLIQGVWLCELSELDSLTRTEENRLKSFLTMRMDSYLPKYSNTRVDIPRRTVFVGTTNDETYLKGQTGNTRFFPVKTGRIDLAVLHDMREQLFAEAVHVYQTDPAHWWCLTPEALAIVKAEREERRVTSVYENALSGWLLDKHRTTWEDIARYFLLLETPERWKDRALQMEITKALKALGWTRGGRESEGGARRRFWYAPEAEA